MYIITKNFESLLHLSNCTNTFMFIDPLPYWVVCVCVLVAQSCPTLCDPIDYRPARLLCSWDFSAKNTGVDCCFSLQWNLPNPGIEPTSPVSPELQVDSLPTEPCGKPIWKYTQLYWSRESMVSRGTRLPSFSALPSKISTSSKGLWLQDSYQTF